MRDISRNWVRAVSFVIVVGAGCTPVEPYPELHPLTGSITRDGQPVTGGGVIFLPERVGFSGLIVDAAVQPDGTFTARTSRTTGAGSEQRPGAPAGVYKVVYHPPGDGSKANRETELPIQVTVEAGPNTASLPLPTGAVTENATAAPGR